VAQDGGMNVLIATPCFGAMVHQVYMLSILKLLCSPLAQRVGFTLEMLGHDSLITRSRNTLVARFLASPAATHLLFVDADIGFEPEQLERMLAFDQPVVAGIYPLKVLHWSGAAERQRAGEAPDAAPLLYVGEPCRGAEAERDGAFITGKHAGTGFMLLRRDALLRMIEAYPETRYRGIDSFDPASAEGSPQYALFDCMIAPETGQYISEDWTFCRRWRALGGKVWLDTLGRLTHVGAHDYVGQPALRFAGHAAGTESTVA
jgi:hypothetical protein